MICRGCLSCPAQCALGVFADTRQPETAGGCKMSLNSCAQQRGPWNTAWAASGNVGPSAMLYHLDSFRNILSHPSVHKLNHSLSGKKARWLFFISRNPQEAKPTYNDQGGNRPDDPLALSRLALRVGQSCRRLGSPCWTPLSSILCLFS